MDAAFIKRLGTGFTPIAVLSVLLLVSLYLMSASIQNTEQFERLFFALLMINLLGLVALVVLIGANMIRLWRQFRNRAAGSRLTLRLVVLFSVLALVPVTVLYYFSLQFINRGIDSWFDVKVERALDDALELSRVALEARKRELGRAANEIQRSLPVLLPEQLAGQTREWRQQYQAEALTLLTRRGRVLAFSMADPAHLSPSMPGQLLIEQADGEGMYISLDRVDDRMFFRLLSAAGSIAGEDVFVYALFPVSDAFLGLTGSVQSSYGEYRKVILLRDPLKFSFTLTLSLVLMLGLLMAVWAGFFSARRLVAPIRVLAIGTRAVAGGDYSKRLPEHSHDELGFLVRSFNEMTDRIAGSTAEAERNRTQVERERAYLRTVLGRLSSGVLTFDRKGAVRTANSAAGQMLGVETRDLVGRRPAAFAELREDLQGLADRITPHLEQGDGEWREEARISAPGGQQVLLTCSGTPLAGVTGSQAGHVLVLEDVTALVQGQRDAAWSEVARRLAHEIRNPLTPIQLSAERLRHKYLSRMDREEGELLDHLTHTIVQQVETLKGMVKAFSDYAYVPKLELKPMRLNTIIEEVALLYRDQGNVRIMSELSADLPELAADDGRLRQLLHNLIRNALEAIGKEQGTVRIVTEYVSGRQGDHVEMKVIDDGPGIPRDLLEHLFEPYVTVKPRGSGLGLAIVKKIVEEHHGQVWAHNNPDGGATVTVQFPVTASGTESARAGAEDENVTGSVS